MSISDVITILGYNPLILATIFTGLPLTAWLYGLPLSRSRAARTPHRYFYAILIYLAAIPGSLALTLTGYSLFFLRADLMSLNLLVFFLPVVSMAGTLVVIKAKVDLDRLPGFDRIIGLIVLLAATFTIALLIQKTKIWVLFHGSLTALAVFIVALFLLLRWAVGGVMGKRS